MDQRNSSLKCRWCGKEHENPESLFQCILSCMRIIGQKKKFRFGQLLNKSGLNFWLRTIKIDSSGNLVYVLQEFNGPKTFEVAEDSIGDYKASKPCP